MDRYWLLTWTTYGTWLPGDPRGFVGRIKVCPGPRIEHDAPGTPYDADLRGLYLASRERMKGPPVWLKLSQAKVLFPQFQETADHRGWLLLAVAIMVNHAHLICGVPGDPDPEDLLRDFKSYGSRALNRRWSKPVNGTWWTESGSKRKLPNREAVHAAVDYVVYRQWRPLLTWQNSIVHGERGASAPRVLTGPSTGANAPRSPSKCGGSAAARLRPRRSPPRHARAGPSR